MPTGLSFLWPQNAWMRGIQKSTKTPEATTWKFRSHETGGGLGAKWKASIYQCIPSIGALVKPIQLGTFWLFSVRVYQLLAGIIKHVHLGGIKLHATCTTILRDFPQKSCMKFGLASYFMTPCLGFDETTGRDLKKMCKEKGVDPWIEIDGGASGKNAKEIKEAGDGCWAQGSLNWTHFWWDQAWCTIHIAVLMDWSLKNFFGKQSATD